MSQSLSCRIEVRGLLDPSWAQAFDGLALDRSPDGTVLTGTVGDQAALHGVLALIRDTGVPIISITISSPA
ncbi:MAG TPA: hypothetical protein VLQ67_06905 [Arachnia sp.]|nr:hypothetical protein [Arachnia sp.]